MSASITDTPMLNYAQQQALNFIRQHPGLNTEAITNNLAGYDNLAARYEIANAVEYLVWNQICNRDARTGAISAIDI